ncbi:helix-turn-helix transcriptional regulator [Halomonas sp. QHL1]|uniref:helix-turn-helix transcriptional regulator n=1 Tax=Halomonas sp. QHL1 TaxID=1123773 RepID=UPI0008FD751E|nr:helix-turn-helix transcriptional regulator [Halomonas sp. QHL1]OJA05983.1 AraC family transcriptional regulator [Halomonas sp. QHL1]
MTSIAAHPISGPKPQLLTSQTLQQLGLRFGIDYRIDGISAGLAPVAQGSVHDVSLPDSLHLTLSDLQVERTYWSASRQSVPWFISVVLEGHITASLDSQCFALTAGDGLCAHFNYQHSLTVCQPAQSRLRTVNLAVLATQPHGLPLPPAKPLLHHWRLPESLINALRATIDHPASACRQPLVWQGLALQLLGHGLPLGPQPTLAAYSASQRPKTRLTPRDRQCLEQLHQRIADQPTLTYCLNDLAHDAAMSPSSLRQKFRACYGYSVFDHLRQCRLVLAYRDLQRGYSVQQTAHACGYRHATNFATAFKRAFGIAPHEVLNRH